jgi:hypothetical protein
MKALDESFIPCLFVIKGLMYHSRFRFQVASKWPVDAFVVITDGMTWAGDTHTSQALVDYRNRTGLDSKLIVINMVAEATRLTDPTDLGSLDVVGFDASVPEIIARFVGGTRQGDVNEDSNGEQVDAE